MRIYVDFDDVVCETARELSRLVEKLYGHQVPYTQILAFNLREAFDLDEERYTNLMRIAHEPDYLLELQPTPGAIATLDFWSEAGHEVEIVTGRPWTTHQASKDWLEAYGVGHIPVIHVDKYNREFVSDTKNVSRALTLDQFSEHSYDLAVEDAPMALDHLAKIPSCRVVIFDRPWNREVPLLTQHFMRCHDWESIKQLTGML